MEREGKRKRGKKMRKEERVKKGESRKEEGTERVRKDRGGVSETHAFLQSPM